jgi:hypothetical protein
MIDAGPIRIHLLEASPTERLRLFLLGSTHLTQIVMPHTLVLVSQLMEPAAKEAEMMKPTEKRTARSTTN